MLWQHVFQAVVCVSSAVRSVTHTLHGTRYTHFRKDQRRLPEDGPDGPKHVAANADILIVNFNILYV
jgi:hypothetical protein